MPGIITHFIAGSALIILGRLYFNEFFHDKQKNDSIKLVAAGLICTYIPDIPLGLYYGFHIFSYYYLLPYHILFTMIIGPSAIAVFLTMDYIGIIKKNLYGLLVYCA